MVGRAAFAFERDFLAAIDLSLVFGCSDRFVWVAAPFAAPLTRRTRPVKIDTSVETELGERRAVIVYGSDYPDVAERAQANDRGLEETRALGPPTPLLKSELALPEVIERGEALVHLGRRGLRPVATQRAPR